MVEQDLLKKFSVELGKRLNEIEKNNHFFSDLVVNRVANEKMLQLEIMHIISQNPNVLDYLPEKLYPNGVGKCDFWFKLKNGIEYWVEIKSRPTNYNNRERQGRAITHGVKGVMADIERLRMVQLENSRRLMIFAFYPIFDDSRQQAIFQRHINRIYTKIPNEQPIPKIRVPISNAWVNLYFESV